MPTINQLVRKGRKPVVTKSKVPFVGAERSVEPDGVIEAGRVGDAMTLAVAEIGVGGAHRVGGHVVAHVGQPAPMQQLLGGRRAA